MITERLILENTGKYIRLGGAGIMDGLKAPRCKAAFLKINGLGHADPEHDDQYVCLQQYRMKRGRILRRYHWDQNYEIITEKEFKTLPIYA